jgi:branched-chain amino acid transport system permease protein
MSEIRAVGKQKKALIALVIFAAFIIGPLVVDVYITYMATIICLFVILAVGLNILIGFSGQISLGHAAFFGIGAYTSALLMRNLGIPFWFSMPIGGLAAAGVGFIVGLPALKVSGHYLALVTLAFGEIIQLIFIHWESLTGGVTGIMVPLPTFFGFKFSTDLSKYYLTLAVTIFLVYCANNIVKSRIGRAFKSIKGSEVASQAMGVDLARFKLFAFMISAFYAGVAGGLYGILLAFISPEYFGLFDSVLYLMMVVIGGLGSIAGSIVGAVVLGILPEVLRRFQDYQDFIYGAILLFFIVFMPMGLVGLFKWAKERFSRLGAMESAGG